MAAPVGVLVVISSGAWGCCSSQARTRGVAATTSPTEAQCSQRPASLTSPKPQPKRWRR